MCDQPTIDEFIKEKRANPKNDHFQGYTLVYNFSKGGYICENYNPMMSLGSILPSKLRELNQYLKSNVKNFKVHSALSGGCCYTFFSFVAIALLMGGFIGTMVYLGINGKAVFIILVMLVMMVCSCLVIFFIVLNNKKMTNRNRDALIQRRKSLMAALEKFKKSDELFKELSFIGFEVGDKGSWIRILFKNEFKERVMLQAKRKIDDRERPFFAKECKRDYYKIPEVNVAVGGKPTKELMDIYGNGDEGGFDYPVAEAEKIPFQ